MRELGKDQSIVFAAATYGHTETVFGSESGSSELPNRLDLPHLVTPHPRRAKRTIAC